MDDARLQPLLFFAFFFGVFAAFFDGWLTKGRAQIAGLFVLFDLSTHTLHTGKRAQIQMQATVIVAVKSR